MVVMRKIIVIQQDLRKLSSKYLYKKIIVKESLLAWNGWFICFFLGNINLKMANPEETDVELRANTVEIAEDISPQNLNNQEQHTQRFVTGSDLFMFS